MVVDQSMRSVLLVWLLGFMQLLLYVGVRCDSVKKVPAIFVFGDSTVDTGNNNQLWTTAKADFFPFGRDFDTRKPTGRFSNGRLGIDYLASFLELPLTSPYLRRKKSSNFQYGVNFASAGSGLLNSTGDIFGQHLSMDDQLEAFMNVRKQLSIQLGEDNATDLISNAIYYISTGTNDFLKNYFTPDSYYAQKYSQDAFQELLVQRISQAIQKLFEMGARKIAVASLPPMGCIPSQLEIFRSVKGSPISSLNLIAQNVNQALRALLLRLHQMLPGSLIIYNNVYDILYNIVANPQSFGLEIGEAACCGAGRYRGAMPCLPVLPVCRNASRYVFWDEFHPTSSVYLILAEYFWQGGLDYSFPMNVESLAMAS